MRKACFFHYLNLTVAYQTPVIVRQYQTEKQAFSVDSGISNGSQWGSDWITAKNQTASQWHIDSRIVGGNTILSGKPVQSLYHCQPVITVAYQTKKRGKTTLLSLQWHTVTVTRRKSKPWKTVTSVITVVYQTGYSGIPKSHFQFLLCNRFILRMVILNRWPQVRLRPHLSSAKLNIRCIVNVRTHGNRVLATHFVRYAVPQITSVNRTQLLRIPFSRAADHLKRTSRLTFHIIYPLSLVTRVLYAAHSTFFFPFLAYSEI